MSVFNNFLVFDTALQGCFVTAFAGDAVAVRARAEPYGQAEHLIPMIEAAMDEAGLAYQELDAIVTTLGPGAFTGLRIGLSAAKAFAMSASVPLYGVSTLQAVAGQYAAHVPEAAFTVVLETKRADFYVQTFDAGGCAAGDAAAQSAGEIENTGQVFVGDAAARLAQELDICVDDGFACIDPVFLGSYFRVHSDVFTRDIEPLYLRGADVSQPKVPPRILAEF